MSTISFTWSFICLTTPFSFNEKLAEKLVKIKVPVWFVILLGVPCTMKFNFKSILCLHHIFSYTIEGSWTIKKPRWLEVMRVLKGMKWKLTTESTSLRYLGVLHEFLVSFRSFYATNAVRGWGLMHESSFL